MLTLSLGFTDEQLDDLYNAERWSLDEQHEIVTDAARPGGFDRIYAVYLRTDHIPDREGYMIYLADGARQFGMTDEALAILRQASAAELKNMYYRAEAPLKPLIEKVRKERRTSYLKIGAVGLSFLAVVSIGAYVYLRPQSEPYRGESY